MAAGAAMVPIVMEVPVKEGLADHQQFDTSRDLSRDYRTTTFDPTVGPLL